MWELLRDNLRRHDVLITDPEWEKLKSHFRYRRFRKHQYILQQGDPSRFENFILSGLARTYETDAKGNEHVIQFSAEDWWTGDMYSFLSGSDSRFNIDCLEDTELIQITKKDLDAVYEEIPVMNKYFRILLQNAFITTTQRIGSGLRLSATERYLEFLGSYPQFNQRIPDHQIASYLGITAQSLSRLRRQMAR